ALGGLQTGCGSDSASAPCEADLAAGELVITEIMAAPSGSDEGQEWIEIHNPTDRAISLKGVSLAYADDREDSGNLYTFDIDHMLEPGAYYVVGSVEPEFQPEYIHHSYGKALGRLGDSDGIVQVQCGTTIVDEVDYDHTGEGSSRLFDGALEPDAEQNDDKDLWCAATEAYDDDNNGSPGVRNQPCMTSPENAGRCRDGDTWREPVKPQVGDLVITEVMTDPGGSADADDAEWFEVYATRDVDLGGLQLGTTKGDEAVLTGANVQ
ncbi:MAG: lamin tail domain-containing protein, partial [Nannocystaceae bacterium]